MIAAPLALAAVLAAAGPGADAGGSAAGAHAPGYVVLDLPAIKRALRESRGHVVLVHFWATWCGPCLEELPVIEKLARESKPRGVEILSLSLDDPERAGARVSKVLSEIAPSLTRSIARIGDADTFIGTFDSRWEGSIPALFAYDAEGRLSGSIVGEATRRDLDDLVGRALKVTARRRAAH